MNSALESHHSKIVLVTKNRSIEAIQKTLQKHKFTRIAENRLEEAEEKFPLLPSGIEKHFIGKLQSRKIARICEYFDLIQTVENLKQAQAISQIKPSMRVMLQVNLSGQTQRSGCTPAQAPRLIQEIQKLPLQLEGVMGMATIDSPEQARQEFRTLKSLQGELPHCSMGMSSDYKIAIEEGSTMLRIGSLFFETHRN